MPSGMEQVVENTLERLVSEDFNRAQLFKERDVAEALRFLLDVGFGRDEYDAGALNLENTTLSQPLTAEVLGGLLVQPQNGTLNLLVSDGVLFCINPDTPLNPDVSTYQYVRDPGVQALGALTIQPNASGSVRVDVVECQPMTVVAETDNRDFYNTVTGLFTPVTVTKATLANLTYRVRAGTPGAGFPGTAEGWLPLCVASVPSGTTVNDTVDFWDVRPLLNDRVNGPTNTTTTFHDVRGDLYAGENTSAAAPWLLRGNVEARLNGRRVGGAMQRGVPGTDATDPYSNFCLDLHDPNNQSPSTGDVTTNAGTLFYLYLACPFGLPRWAFYTPASAGPRQPRSPRGIPVVSDLGTDTYGSPAGNLALPTQVFGVATSTTAAVCVAAVPRRYSGGTTWSLTGKFVQWAYQDQTGFNAFLNTAIIGAGSGTVITYQDTNISGLLPAHAVSCRFLAGWTLSPGANAQTGWHYSKTLASGASATPFARNTVREGVVWLPSDYFNLTGVIQQDAMWGDFPRQGPDDSDPTVMQFAVYLYSGDATVAIGVAGSAPHIMVPNFAGTLTAGGYLGYWHS